MSQALVPPAAAAAAQVKLVLREGGPLAMLRGLDSALAMAVPTTLLYIPL